MSKYDPLRFALERERSAAVPMKFRDVEDVLGFPLPPSARRHQPWWANTGGSHVHARAWLKAGWRVTGVDLNRERVTFVRDGDRNASPSKPKAADAGEAPAAITIRPDDLTPLARRFLRTKAAEIGGDYPGAVKAILDETPIRERKRIIDWFAANSPKVAGDSAELIREDRDER